MVLSRKRTKHLRAEHHGNKARICSRAGDCLCINYPPFFEQDRPNCLPSHLKTFCETRSAPVFGLFPSSSRKTFQGLKGSLATRFITAGMQHKPLVQMLVGLVSILDFWGVIITRKSHGISDQRFLWDHQTFSGD